MNDTTQPNDTTQQRGGFFTIAAWQRADDLAVKVYQVTKNSPPFERFGLTAQMQRAAVSVAANIALGSGQQTLPNYIRFLYLAKGSLHEVEYDIHLSHRLGYLSAREKPQLQRQKRMTAGALLGFIAGKENQLQHRRD